MFWNHPARLSGLPGSAEGLGSQGHLAAETGGGFHQDSHRRQRPGHAQDLQRRGPGCHHGDHGRSTGESHGGPARRAGIIYLYYNLDANNRQVILSDPEYCDYVKDMVVHV